MTGTRCVQLGVQGFVNARAVAGARASCSLVRNLASMYSRCFFFFQAEDGIRDYKVTGVQTCALPISPKGGPKVKVNEIGVDTAPEKFEVRWSDEATARFKRIPYFMQAMVKKSVEAKARERGLSVITPEFMEELRKARFGNEKPVFKF